MRAGSGGRTLPFRTAPPIPPAIQAAAFLLHPLRHGESRASSQRGFPHLVGPAWSGFFLLSPDRRKPLSFAAHFPCIPWRSHRLRRREDCRRDGSPGMASCAGGFRKPSLQAGYQRTPKLTGSTFVSAATVTGFKPFADLPITAGVSTSTKRTSAKRLTRLWPYIPPSRY